MKKVKLFILISALSLIVLAGVFAVRAHAQGNGITVEQRVVMESYRHGGNTVLNRRLNAFSDRGMALLERDEYAYGSLPGYHYRMLKMADGRRIDVFDPIKAKTTYYVPKGREDFVAMTQDRARAQCANKGYEIEGAETIAGVPTIRVHRASADREFTIWMAPSAGCIEVQKIATFKDPKTGAVTDKTSYFPESVKFGPPEDSIFDVPANYVEKAPEQVQAARLTYKYGSVEAATRAADCPKCLLDQVTRKDHVYELLKTPPTILARMRSSLNFTF